MDYLTSQTSLSPIRRGFEPCFVIYKKGCTRLAAASDKVHQLLAHGRWFFPGTPVSSTTKTGRHDIAEILLKVALNTKNQTYTATFLIQRETFFMIRSHTFVYYILPYCTIRSCTFTAMAVQGCPSFFPYCRVVIWK